MEETWIYKDSENNIERTLESCPFVTDDLFYCGDYFIYNEFEDLYESEDTLKIIYKK